MSLIIYRTEVIINYISSLENNTEQYQQNIRSNWGAENKLHWTFDVDLYKDESRKRNKNAAKTIQFY